MADKRISQLIERTDIANNDVLPIVASGATTTNKVTISTIQDWMQDNLDVGVTSVGITLGTTGTDVNVTGSPITTSGNITINIPSASATARGLVTTGVQTFAGDKTFNDTIVVNDDIRLVSKGTALQTFITNSAGDYTGYASANSTGFNLRNNTYVFSSGKQGYELDFNNTQFRFYELPDADGTIALTSQLDGYVTLGTAQTITAQKTFTTSGSSDTMIISHGSGSGIALDVIKAGNGEAIRIQKTSGTGNAVTITGGLLSAEAATLTGALNGTSGTFTGAVISTAVSVTATTGIAGDFTNNSSTNETLRARNNGSGNIAAFRNLSGQVASITNSGGLNLSGALNGTSATFTAAGSTFVSATTTGGSDMRISSGATNGFVGTTSNHPLSFVVNNGVVGTIAVGGAATFSSSITASNLFTTSMSGSAINIRGDESLNSNFGITWSTPTYSGGLAAIRVARRGASDASDMMFFTAPNGDLPAERMRITSTGNVGIGVTPSAWNTAYKAIQFGSTGALFGEVGDSANYLTSNAFIDSVGFKYITSDFATGYFQENGVHSFKTAVSGTAGNAITWTTPLSLASTGAATFSSSVTAGGNITSSALEGKVVITSTAGSGKSYQFISLDTGNLGLFDGTAYRLWVAGSGNVGIGTASPNSILEISSTTPVFRIQASDSANFHGIEFRQGSGFDSFIKQLPSTGEFRISNGRSVGWGGFTTFYTDTAERMRITSTGNVGIGTASPAGQFEVYTDIYRRLYTSNIDAYTIRLVLGANSYFQQDAGNEELRIAQQYGSGKITFYTGSPNAERMRITSGGELLWNVTGLAGADLNTGGVLFRNNAGKYVQISTGLTTDSSLMLFYKSNGAGSVTNTGSISTSGNLTLYNTTSDYRLKEDLQDFNALEKIANLKIYDFAWKHDQTRSYGVLAHELAEVLPYSVFGEKDAIEEDEEPKLQQVDYSKIVPILIKAIQEQQEQIDSLKNQINQL